MAHRRAALRIRTAFVIAGAIAPFAHAGDAPAPSRPRIVDAVKAKAQELEKQRLLARLHADAPKVADPEATAHPVDSPVFHRYDRPWLTGR